MKKTNVKELAKGKYALRRRAALEKFAPEMFRAMSENGSLEKHLADVQETASDYIEMYVERFKLSEEYIRVSANDPALAARYLNMTVLEAEEAADRTWVTNFPENEDEDGEENV